MHFFSISDDNSEKQNGENYADDEEGDGDGDVDGEAGDYDSSEFDDDEIENLLDEKLPDDLRESKRPKYEQRFKTVLEGDFPNNIDSIKGFNRFSFLHPYREASQSL